MPANRRSNVEFGLMVNPTDRESPATAREATFETYITDGASTLPEFFATSPKAHQAVIDHDLKFMDRVGQVHLRLFHGIHGNPRTIYIDDFHPLGHPDTPTHQALRRTSIAARAELLILKHLIRHGLGEYTLQHEGKVMPARSTQLIKSGREDFRKLTIQQHHDLIVKHLREGAAEVNRRTRAPL